MEYFMGTPIEIIEYYVNNYDEMKDFRKKNFEDLIMIIIKGSNIPSLIELYALVDEKLEYAKELTNEKAMSHLSNINNNIELNIISKFELLSNDEKQTLLAEIEQRTTKIQNRLEKLSEILNSKKQDDGMMKVTYDSVLNIAEQMRLEKYLEFYQKYYQELGKKRTKN